MTLLWFVDFLNVQTSDGWKSFLYRLQKASAKATKSSRERLKYDR
jgi:hypothetical protein